MTSKLSVKLYKGNYKWVQNQLRLFAAYEVCGSAGSQEGIQEPWKGNSQEGSLPGPSTPLTCSSFPSFRPFFPNNSTCCTLATLPTMAASWIFLRTLSRMRYPGWKLIPWPLSLTGLMEEPKGDTPFLLLKPKLFFIAEPTDSKHISPLPWLFTVP